MTGCHDSAGRFGLTWTVPLFLLVSTHLAFFYKRIVLYATARGCRRKQITTMDRACRATKREPVRACPTRSLFRFPLSTPPWPYPFALDAPLCVVVMSFPGGRRAQASDATHQACASCWAWRDKVQKRDSRNGVSLFITAVFPKLHAGDSVNLCGESWTGIGARRGCGLFAFCMFDVGACGLGHGRPATSVTFVGILDALCGLLSICAKLR